MNVDELHSRRSEGAPLRTLHLFAGAGGGLLADIMLGHVPVCAVELEPRAAAVLAARQRDGALPWFPIWDDVRTFAGRPWRGKVDVVAGGFPCQDISVAGAGAGISGKRSGLWREFARIVREVRPRHVFVENSPALTARGLDRVLGDLATIGYDAKWCVLGADDAGAPHRRKRIWILADAAEQHRPVDRRQAPEPGRSGPDDADADSLRELQPKGCERGKRRRAGNVRPDVPDADLQRREERQPPKPTTAQHPTAERGGWWSVEPGMGGVADGLAARLDIHGADAVGNVGRVAAGIPGRVGRLKMLGNGQVPATAAMAWRMLMEITP